MKRRYSQSDRYPFAGQVLLGLGDGDLAEMKDGSTQHCRRFADGYSFIEMLQLAGAAGSRNWNLDHLGYRLGHFEVVALFGTVRIPAGQQYFARSQLLHSLGPLDDLNTRLLHA